MADTPGVPAPGIVAQILITLNDKGQVEAAGAIDNKMVALGLLETAKDAILQRIHDMEKGNVIQAPPPGMASMLSFGRKKGD